MSVVLIGYRGSGKTTVGRKLAQRMRIEFIDCDDLIVAKAGKSIREIFAHDGEARFRELETQVLREVVARKDHVIGLGGGAVVREENRKILAGAGHSVLYLHCQPEELLRRIQNDPATSDNRPNLTSLGGGIEEIQTLLSQREPMYESAMTHKLDVTHLTPDEAVARILQLL
jgi:shikimate kinase